MRLLLIRHAQTPSNVAGLLDTAPPGPGLTELGQEQAAALVPALEHEPVEVVLVSTARRTHETAAPLVAARGLPVTERDGIREVAAGDLEMAGDEDSVQQYLAIMAQWAEGDLERRMPGGESGHEFLGRFDSVVREVETTGAGTAVLFSHGAAIRCWVGSRAVNDVLDYVTSHPLHNTGILVLEGSTRDGWTLLSFEEDALGGPAVEEAPAHSGPGAETILDEQDDAR